MSSSVNRTKTVVGWGCLEETCEDKVNCNGDKPATVYVTYDGCEMIPSCKDCTPPLEYPDKIADVLSRIFP